MNNKGIIFDLDGTLWEVTDSTYYSANEIAKKYNQKEVTIDTICHGFGFNKVDSAKLYFPYLELDKSLKLIEELVELNIENLKNNGGNVYPNLEDTLITLKENYKLFIVSNTSQDEYIEAFLNSSGLKKYFKGYIAASKLQISKGAAIEKVIKDYNLKKSVYVGDTKKDMEAANKAQIPFIQAKYGFGEDLKTKYYINRINELPNIINNIFNEQ